MAAAALDRSMNANVLRRWVVEAERAEAGVTSPIRALPISQSTKDSFVAIPLATKATDEAPIRVEVRRGSTTVSVQWPASAMRECALWLQEVLK
jgi:transposase